MNLHYAWAKEVISLRKCDSLPRYAPEVARMDERPSIHKSGSFSRKEISLGNRTNG